MAVTTKETTMPTYADLSRVVLSYARESQWGVIPTGSFNKLRFTSEGLTQSINTEVSEERRPDRQITDVVPNNYSVEGDISFELSYGSQDVFMEAGLCNQWSDAISETSEVSVLGGKIVFSTVPKGFDLLIGKALRLSGFSDKENNRIVLVSAFDQSTKTLTVLPSLKNVSTPASITFKGQHLTNGTMPITYTIEKGFTDIEQYFMYMGLTTDKFSITMASEAKVSSTVSFIGKESSLSQTTVAGGYTEANTNDIMMSMAKASNNMLMVDGVPNAYIKSLSINVDNGAKSKRGLASFDAIGVGKDFFAVTGTMSVYFRDNVFYQKFINNERSSITSMIDDSKTGSYLFYLPAVKYGECTVTASGGETDIMVDISFQALMDATTGKTFIISKLPL